MSTHTCGAVLPTTTGPFVEHLAACPDTTTEISAWCQALVKAAAYGSDLPERSVLVSRDENETATRHDLSRETSERDKGKTSVVSRDKNETRPVSRDMTASQMAVLRDKGETLRAIAAAAGVAPETVRRRLARHETQAQA